MCITKCPSDSIQLFEKEDTLDIPDTFLAMNIAIARERGQILGWVPYNLVKWMLKD